MDEFWVCPKCRSLNRAHASRCYSCHWKFGRQMPTSSPVVAGQGTPGPAPQAAAAPQQQWAAPPPSAASSVPVETAGSIGAPAVPAAAQAAFIPSPIAASPVAASPIGASPIGASPLGAAAGLSPAAPNKRRFGLPGLRRSKDSVPAPDARGTVAAAAAYSTPSYPQPAYTPPPVYGATPGYVSTPAGYVPVAYGAATGAAPRRRFSIGARLGRLPIIRSFALREAFAPRGAYVSVRRFGFVAAAMLAVLAVVAAILVPIALRLAQQAIHDGSLDGVRATLDAGGESMLQSLMIAFVAIGAVSLVCFSIVVAVSTHNGPSLGADLPMLTPGGSVRSWFNLVWAWARIGFGLIVPLYLFLRGYGIVGALVWLVMLERLQRNMSDIDGWLTRPARHLTDLYDKLALKGTGSLLARAWRVAFYTANVLGIAVAAIPLAIVVAGQVATYAKPFNAALVTSSTTLNVGRTVALGLVALFASVALLTVALLVPITIDLVRRQQTRRVLVIAGLGRPRTMPAGAAPDAAPLGGGYGPETSPEDEERGWGLAAPEPQPQGEEPEPMVPAWRRREVTKDAGPVTFASWLDRLKADQAREAQARAAAEKIEEQAIGARPAAGAEAAPEPAAASEADPGSAPAVETERQ